MSLIQRINTSIKIEVIGEILCKIEIQQSQEI